MINNDEPNVILTSEQLKAIEETKTRLFNLESEISIATKNIKSLKAETERAIKDKAYQEELLAEVVSKISMARSQLAEVEPQIAEKTAELSNLSEKIRVENVSYETKKLELKDREDSITQREIDIKKDVESVNKGLSNLDMLGKAFDTKVAKLKEVLKDF